MARRYPALVDATAVERWAASGAMALTGLPDEPLGPPGGLVEGVERISRPFADLDGLALLGERAALMGLWRRGATSCGGSCRLLRSAGGWVAVSLPRREDMELVPAWLELDTTPETTTRTWDVVTETLAQRDPEELMARAELLGLPVARVGEAVGARAVARCPARTGAGSNTGRLPDRGPVRPVGRAPLRRPAGERRSGRGQGRVDGTSRWCAARPAHLLRPAERPEAIRRARLPEPRGHSSAAHPGTSSGHRHRGEQASRPRATRHPRRRRRARRRAAGVDRHRWARPRSRRRPPCRLR